MLKYAIKTYGCKLNQAETTNLKRVAEINFEKTTPKKADLVIINSCGVIKKTELKILKEAKRLKKKGKKVIITGCLPAISKKAKKVADFTMTGNDPMEFEKIINRIFKRKEKENYSQPPTISKEGSCSIIIPISSGCLGNCSYCATKLARGSLKSYPIEKIIEEIEKGLDKGIKEIQLTSQDLAIYGKDRGDFSLVKLLKKIISIDGNFRVKLGMMNLRFLNSFQNEFLDLFKSEKIYNFLHLPIQSGSDKVLADMQREHSVEDFIQLIKAIRSRYDDFMIATDIIVGFPTESDESFNKSYNLIKRLNLDIVNITRYSERENTKAKNLDDMPSKIKKERSRKLAKLTKKQRINKNKKEVGKEKRGLIVRKGKDNTKLARLENGKAVILPAGKIGDFKKIKINGYKHNYLTGKIYD